MVTGIVAETSEEVKLEEYIFGDTLPPDECGCVLPEHSCSVCQEAARAVYDGDGDELPF